MSKDDSPETMEENRVARTVFEQVYRRHRRALLTFFHRRSINSGEVEELVQETYLRLVACAQGANLNHTEGYLFTIASNLANDWHRTRLTRQVLAAEVLCTQTNLDSEEIDVERFAIARQETRLVATALEQLPELTRDIFLLNRLERVAYRTLARRYDLTVAEVRKHMSLAFRALNDAIEGQRGAQTSPQWS
jgi:RNA polymerase sigma-70 factor (ECF subfamily)